VLTGIRSPGRSAGRRDIQQRLDAETRDPIEDADQTPRKKTPARASRSSDPGGDDPKVIPGTPLDVIRRAPTNCPFCNVCNGASADKGGALLFRCPDPRHDKHSRKPWTILKVKLNWTQQSLNSAGDLSVNLSKLKMIESSGAFLDTYALCLTLMMCAVPVFKKGTACQDNGVAMLSLQKSFPADEIQRHANQCVDELEDAGRPGGKCEIYCNLQLFENSPTACIRCYTFICHFLAFESCSLTFFQRFPVNNAWQENVLAVSGRSPRPIWKGMSMTAWEKGTRLGYEFMGQL
jgi:hypothetical protein